MRYLIVLLLVLPLMVIGGIWWFEIDFPGVAVKVAIGVLVLMLVLTIALVVYLTKARLRAPTHKSSREEVSAKKQPVDPLDHHDDHHDDHSHTSKQGGKWFIPALVTIGVAVLLWYIWTHHEDTVRDVWENITSVSIDTSTGPGLESEPRSVSDDTPEIPPVSLEERDRIENQKLDPIFAPPAPGWSDWYWLEDFFTLKTTPGPGSNLFTRQCSLSYEKPGVGDDVPQKVSCDGQARWIRFQGTDQYGITLEPRFVLT